MGMLSSGDVVRYRGLGPGRVREVIERSFQGQDRQFAVIHFPHRDLTAQVPIGDPAVAHKLSAVSDPADIRQLLEELDERGKILPRTWDNREEIGQRALTDGGPEEWAELLGSYALAQRAGVQVASSDGELVRQAQELMAAELACALRQNYDRALKTVKKHYLAAQKGPAPSAETVTHFQAVEV
jgi:RNA polymerase-interacting CarD/CdnL/TRCF family regulator